MAQNIADIRETIGINDKPIMVCAMENINITERKKNRLGEGNHKKVKDVKITDLSENMLISVFTGNNPNKQEEIQI